MKRPSRDRSIGGVAGLGNTGAAGWVVAGRMVGAYAEAAAAAGFHLYWGADAKQQSPDMGDLLLHEIVVVFN